MEEFKFVLKCLIISCVIVIFSQTRVAGETLENKAFVFLQHSPTAQWIRAAADGGVKLIREGITQTQDFISQKLGHSEEKPAANTGLFRKLEKNQTQQRGITAESDLDEKMNNEDRF